MFSENFEITEICEADKAFISDLMSNSLIEEYSSHNSEENIPILLEHYYNRSDSIIFVLKIEKQFAGFVWLVQSTDIVTNKSYYCILYIAIEKKFRGKKMSQLLLDKAISYCKEKDIAELRLTVRHNNIPALNLYKLNNFHIYKHEMKLIIN